MDGLAGLMDGLCRQVRQKGHALAEGIMSAPVVLVMLAERVPTVGIGAEL